METWFTASLTQIEKTSDELYVMHFAVPGGEHIHYVPGQFVKIEMNDGEPFQRSYSIATMSDTSNFANGLEIAVSWVDDGRASECLFSMECGASVDVYGPFGQLFLPDPKNMPKRLWLVGTGTGVAPYKAMVPDLKQLLAAGKVDIRIVVGARDQAGIPYLSLWRSLSEQLPNFELSLCFSQTMPKVLQGDEVMGRVQAVISDASLNPDSDLFYLCGNPDMIDDVFALLKDRGFAVKSVRREKYVYAIRR
ncbi:Flavodoxin/ferredoxin--NADP reductase [BD1-7 clade bacterium]|uniref:Flavodoxin/ferredoxin--NADP reductase n=1 Tax=BD1-7 clade bacterium TaxID=2029982 RepID=A0A5S9PWD9_9GAMM|nr:Flavodoxin/ferredoxin--NADP reductase [BD1-7 clade bacterium]CAA0108863.1 Flavodoxin/ferredoxin--NADP reductase [BD1-7 clade bacterium]